MLNNFTKIYSPNFDIPKRSKNEIKYLILHYTGMKKEKSALSRLTNFGSKVSCHYFISYSGEILNLVPDLYISWHAGKSKWKGRSSFNSESIGIEISNPGHENGYTNFRKKQINSLISLLILLKKKYNIQKKNILGHSDIAPDRKKDPGEKFPWQFLSKKKISIWHDLDESYLRKLRNKKCTILEKKKFYINIKKIGYDAKNINLMGKAFQRRFRQKLINGKVDKECYIISISLIKKI